MSMKDTPLGQQTASHLLDGLDVYTVPALGDEHPLTVYGINSTQIDEASCLDSGERKKNRPILLLHGRTWSSVPVYHLLGGPKNEALGKESRSLMESMFNARGLQPYTMDFRGFGGTPPDETKIVEPNRCVSDVESVLKWIADRHDLCPEHNTQHCQMPALLGWSQGGLVAQLVAQKAPSLVSKLILYGSIYDRQVRYPRAPLYATTRPDTTEVYNDYDDAIEDFTVEGSIAPEPAKLFAEAALLCDPIKAQWFHLHQFNNCDPARVNVPTLLVGGDQDPYAPLHIQGELFSNLGRGADRTWSIIADADHAVHLLDDREKFVKIVKGFVENGTKGKGGVPF